LIYLSFLLQPASAGLAARELWPRFHQLKLVANTGRLKPTGDQCYAIATGEKIGLYKDWPVSKGCIPPYVPVNDEALQAGHDRLHG